MELNRIEQLRPRAPYLNTTAGAGVVTINNIQYIAHSDPENLYSCGYWLELDITTTGAANLILQSTASDESGGSYYRRLHTGEVAYSGCEAQVLGTIANFRGLELRTLYVGPNTMSADFYHDPGYTANDGVNEAHNITLMTPETVIPAGATGVTPQLYILFMAAGTAKVRIGRFSCYRVDNPVRVGLDKYSVQ